MSADSTLLIIVGLCGGFALGYVTAWRFSRKLERHDVSLAAWDQPYDARPEEREVTMTHIPDPLEIKLIAFRDELFYLGNQESCMDESSLQRALAFERAARIVMQYIPLVVDAERGRHDGNLV